MAPEQRKLVTIVTESVIEIDLCEALTDLGASGYTVTNARGSGSRGIRNAGWSSNSNIRIEVVCDEPVATRIAEHLREHYYADFAMILFESDVRVLRPDKF
ncbi:MAG: transcriptional regulator [Woeseiaceae bacterium]|jgi:nitrogen regulatory protein PII|nr:transcriptional regulator [Woeseiaceae bacterium]